MTITLLLLSAVSPWGGLAYIGPGGGLSALGALVALIFAVIVSIFGFVWYPVRRLIRTFRDRDDEEGSDE